MHLIGLITSCTYGLYLVIVPSQVIPSRQGIPASLLGTVSVNY